jgi:hypothetical protein
MTKPRNPKPLYPPQFRQQMVGLVAAGQMASMKTGAVHFGCKVLCSCENSQHTLVKY